MSDSAPSNSNSSVSKLDGRNKRLFNRYEIPSDIDLKGSLVGGPLGEELVSMSLGGCGFTAPVSEAPFKLWDKVICQFHVDSDSKTALRIRGEICYSVPHPLPDDRLGRFYGVRFLASELSQIQLIIGQLERWYAMGQIHLAP